MNDADRERFWEFHELRKQALTWRQLAERIGWTNTHAAQKLRLWCERVAIDIAEEEHPRPVPPRAYWLSDVPNYTDEEERLLGRWIRRLNERRDELMNPTTGARRPPSPVETEIPTPFRDALSEP